MIYSPLLLVTAPVLASAKYNDAPCMGSPVKASVTFPDIETFISIPVESVFAKIAEGIRKMSIAKTT